MLDGWITRSFRVEVNWLLWSLEERLERYASFRAKLAISRPLLLRCAIHPRLKRFVFAHKPDQTSSLLRLPSQQLSLSPNYQAYEK